MNKDKKDLSLPAFRVTEKMYIALNTEKIKEHRDMPEQIRVLLAEALAARQAKDNIIGYL